MKVTKNRYLKGFVGVVLFLALVRLVFPSVAEGRHDKMTSEAMAQQPQGEKTEENAPDSMVRAHEDVLVVAPDTMKGDG